MSVLVTSPDAEFQVEILRWRHVVKHLSKAVLIHGEVGCVGEDFTIHRLEESNGKRLILKHFGASTHIQRQHPMAAGTKQGQISEPKKRKNRLFSFRAELTESSCLYWKRQL